MDSASARSATVLFPFANPFPAGYPRELTADLMVPGEVADNRRRDVSLIGMDRGSVAGMQI